MVGASYALCAGCGEQARPTIAVSPRDGLADAPLRIRIENAPQGAVVLARATDAGGKRYESRTPVAEAVREPWRTIVSMRGGSGSFAAMLPALTVRFDVVDGGKVTASATVTRRFVPAGVRGRDIRDGLYGRLYEPAKPTAAPVLVIGGSDGGLRAQHIAALLAAHGHKAMALAYFGAPGLPRRLARIPLEYFRRALRRLGGRPAILGISRGGEAALLLGSTYPRLVGGVVALVPSNHVNGSPDGKPGPAWTLHGRGLPYPAVPGDPGDPRGMIRAERIHGPVLTVSAGRDGLWPSAGYAAALHERLDRSGFRHPHRDLSFADAGHGVGSAVPYIPTLTFSELGGSAQADEAGRERSWPQILRFLDGI